MSALRRIVFVCTGNMCRSPFAEHALRKLAGDAVEVSSAGLIAFDGGQAAPAAVRAAGHFGIDLTAHRTRALDGSVFRRADGIYVFERMQRDNIEALFPDLASRIHLLGACLGTDEAEIADPIGGSDAGIIACYETILRACRALRNGLEDA